MSTKKKKDPYSKETIVRKRSFPTAKTVGLVIMVAVQLLCLTFAILYNPKPQDRIERYEIIAEPLADGSVDLEYRFVWTALDKSEALTWVDIGMANKFFEFYGSSFSSNIEYYEKNIDGDYVSARLYFDRAYKGGETLTFSFRVNQRELLCKDEDGYFYEFVPGWFNSTPVESYCFVWKNSPKPKYVNTPFKLNGDPSWEGRMPCGSYIKMNIDYNAIAFLGASTVEYEEFYDGDISNSLEESKMACCIIMGLICLVLLITQVYMIDSVISYHRGRGFLTGYGHHIHIYGRTNPKYTREKENRVSSSGTRGFRSGGGCACACACACAGGGRAGCSQKDTHAFPVRRGIQAQHKE